MIELNTCSMTEPSTARRTARGCRAFVLASALAGALQLVGLPASAAEVGGVDVSSLHGEIDWPTVSAAGVAFVYVKATEGLKSYNNSFAQQYDGAFSSGLSRGAYHVALPDASSGTEQAEFFVHQGGDYVADFQTLPGALDLESNPSGEACYGLSPDEMNDWIHDFADEYRALTGRNVIIYTSAEWWNTCTGSSTDFGESNPLWVAHLGGSAPELPAGWNHYTFWNYSNTGAVDGIEGEVNQSVFAGSPAQLQALVDKAP